MSIARWICSFGDSLEVVWQLHAGFELDSLHDQDDKVQLMIVLKMGLDICIGSYPRLILLHMPFSRSKSGLTHENPRVPINRDNFYQTVYQRFAPQYGNLIDRSGHQTSMKWWWGSFTRAVEFRLALTTVSDSVGEGTRTWISRYHMSSNKVQGVLVLLIMGVHYD